MPESYALIEMELHQSQTMPPTQSGRATWLHAAVDSDGGEVIVACLYPVVTGRDVSRRDLPFSDFTARTQQTPKCPACSAAIEATL
jgi:hypothetical protein